MAESHPAYNAISYLTGAGVITGFADGTFGPSKTLTRGQATKVLVLWQALKIVVPATPSFPDLDDVYRPYVETATAQRWITGFPDGCFKPYATLNRQQMAVIMVRAMGWDADAKDLSADSIADTLSVFKDRSKIASVARPYVALAVSRGLFGGSDGGFAPQQGITRAQFSLVVFRAELSLRATVQAVRASSDYPDKTRVVVDLSRAPGKVTAAATVDGMLTIDFTGGAMASTMTQAIGSVEVTSLTARQFAYNPRTVRLTFDLGRYKGFRVMSLAPSEDKGYRIVLDVYKRTDGPDGDGPPLICVDAGHGGDAPGATGVDGTPEKTLDLAIALVLQADLQQAGLQVLMTRTDDTSVGLEERAEIANKAKANLFVCVHNNAFDGVANGTETYYYGTSTGYSPEGKLLAGAIQRHLIAALGSVDRGIHMDTFTVLSATDMTAVLAEVGFMDNATEEAKLLTPQYQALAAQAITDGVLEYLQWSTTVYTTEE